MIAVKCPVCNGNGLVPNGYYTQTSGIWGSTSTSPETCRGCNGRGWVEVSDNLNYYGLTPNTEEIK